MLRQWIIYGIFLVPSHNSGPTQPICLKFFLLAYEKHQLQHNEDNHHLHIVRGKTAASPDGERKDI